jgi:hypothetical protein
VEYQISEGMSAFWAPWYQYSAIGKSDLNTKYGFYEPASRTHQLGSRFGIIAKL